VRRFPVVIGQLVIGKYRARVECQLSWDATFSTRSCMDRGTVGIRAQTVGSNGVWARVQNVFAAQVLM